MTIYDFWQLEGTATDDITIGCSLLAVKSNGHNRDEKENVLEMVTIMQFVQGSEGKLLILTTLKIKF